MLNHKTETILDVRNILGEGLCVSPTAEGFAWVDIHTSEIFHHHDDDGATASHRIDGIPSAIFHTDNNGSLYLSDQGIFQFDLESGASSPVIRFPPHVTGLEFRGNDGVMLENGAFIFGTMHKTDPGMHKGTLCIAMDDEIRTFGEMHIPNTFIVAGEHILISDSLTGCIHRYARDTLSHDGIWADLSGQGLTPDGGCFASNENIYIALWGDASIGVFDPDGNMLDKIPVPAYQPTNCKVFRQSLIVTSATEGMNEDLLHQYPGSGNVLVIHDVLD